MTICGKNKVVTARPEMSCQDLVELVTDHLEGAFDAETQALFEARLETCDGCRAYIEQLRTIVRVLGRLPEESLLPEVRDRLLDLFRSWRGTRS